MISSLKSLFSVGFVSNLFSWFPLNWIHRPTALPVSPYFLASWCWSTTGPLWASSLPFVYLFPRGAHPVYVLNTIFTWVIENLYLRPISPWNSRLLNPSVYSALPPWCPVGISHLTKADPTPFSSSQARSALPFPFSQWLGLRIVVSSLTCHRSLPTTWDSIGSPFTCLQTPNPPTWAPPTSPLMWIILPAQQALASPLLPAVQILRAAAGVLLTYAPWWAVSIHSPLITTCHLSVKARAHTVSLRAAPTGSLSPLTAPALAELTSCLSTNLGICTFCPLLQRLFLSPESACSPLQQVLA